MTTAQVMVRVVYGDRQVALLPLVGPLELGRRRDNDPEPYQQVPASATGPARLIIAPREERTVPRAHLLLEPLPDGRVRATNHSPIPFPRADGGSAIPAQSSLELTPPFRLSLPPRLIVVGNGDCDNEDDLQSLAEMTIGPGRPGNLSRPWKDLDLSSVVSGPVEAWLKETVGVLQSTVGSADFLNLAAKALVQIVGLNTGHVLLLSGEDWKSVACFEPAGPRPGWAPRRHVLDRVRKEKKTFWQTPAPLGGQDSSGLPPQCRVVAAPLLDAENQVVGALYGERPADSTVVLGKARLEALLVDLLACGVATGLARQKQELATVAMREQMDQFITPRLADLLRRDRHLLDVRDALVTVLFCDVRGFSRISENLKPEPTVRWMSDVLSVLSECVLDEEGFIVDYIGDELMALWGAPEPQEDQRQRAIRAALAMVAALVPLNDRWRLTLGESMDVGIGVHTGSAYVGNVGSRFKNKYGALGNTVNQGSRVRGLTKFLKSRLLVTAEACRDLGEGFIRRRVVRTGMVNIREPLDLYEVEARSSPERATFFRDAESALTNLEAARFAESAGLAGSLLLGHRGDGPLLLTLSRATTQMVQGGPFDPVWEPPGK